MDLFGNIRRPQIMVRKCENLLKLYICVCKLGALIISRLNAQPEVVPTGSLQLSKMLCASP